MAETHWLALTVDMLKQRVSGPEYEAYTTAALASGQTDPIPDILADVVTMIRGYVAACSQNVLGPEGMVPGSLKSQAVIIARHEVITRLPGLDKKFLGDGRVREYEAAMRLMEQVAACKFAVTQPEEASEEEIAGAAVEVALRPCRKATRETLDGL
jgi:hypothetical protein